MNRTLKTILTGVIPAAVFCAAFTLFKPVFTEWSSLALLGVYDALMSLSFAFCFMSAFNFRKTKKAGVILFIGGLVLSNALVWSLSFPLSDEGRQNTFAMAVTGIVMITLVAVFTFIFFMRSKSEKAVLVTGIIASAAVLAFGLTNIASMNETDSIYRYKKDIAEQTVYENTLAEALPQTVVYEMVNAHFSSSLPEGKTAKKCFIMGYDGARADLLSFAASEDSAVTAVLKDGGRAYLSYCGGIPFPEKNTQATSTAPGWCSILTGQWAEVTGVTDNGIPKSTDCLTCLTTLVESKKASSSAFYTSWGGHFSNSDSTYYPEKQYAEERGLNVSFVCSGGDDETFALARENVEKENCDDLIFCILEHCDGNGHGTGFRLENENYVNGFRTSDRMYSEILAEIKNRKTYAEEDWLIILTADHGGFDRGHGSSSIQERYTFIVTNGEIAA